jgi:hypothetical protein
MEEVYIIRDLIRSAGVLEGNEVWSRVVGSIQKNECYHRLYILSYPCTASDMEILLNRKPTSIKNVESLYLAVGHKRIS